MEDMESMIYISDKQQQLRSAVLWKKPTYGVCIECGHIDSYRERARGYMLNTHAYRHAMPAKLR
jgi:hypothetical protein